MMTTVFLRLCVPFAGVVLTLAPLPAVAEIKDYEVLRLVYLHSSCGMGSIISREADGAVTRFKVDCQNKTAFPDGAHVECQDPHDDRSCKIVTESTNFEHLRLLAPKEK